MVIYALSPVDFLPELALGPLGLLDDSLVMAGMVRQVSSILYGFVREEARREWLCYIWMIVAVFK